MKKLLLVAAVLGIGGFAYWKLRSPEAKAASKLESLCGEKVSSKDLSDAKELLGDHYDAALDCVNDSTSCPEALGCLLGGAGDRLDEVGKQLEHGVERYRKNR
jgi:hypothetical protein